LSLTDIASDKGQYSRCDTNHSIEQIQRLISSLGIKISKDEFGYYGEDTQDAVSFISENNGEFISQDEIIDIALYAAKKGQTNLLSMIVNSSNWDKITDNKSFKLLYKTDKALRKKIDGILRKENIGAFKKGKEWFFDHKPK